MPSYVDTGAFARVLNPSRAAGNQEERLQIFRRIGDEIATRIRACLAERVV